MTHYQLDDLVIVDGGLCACNRGRFRQTWKSDRHGAIVQYVCERQHEHNRPASRVRRAKQRRVRHQVVRV